MKCPKCEHRQKPSTGQKCEQCKYTYAFTDKNFSDRYFLKLIDKVSVKDTLFFTFDQLYAADYHYLTRRRIVRILISVLIALLPGVLLGTVMHWAFSFISLPIIWIVVTRIGKPRPVDDFRAKLDTYLRIHPIPKLLQKPDLHQAPKAAFADIADYGAERILIVSRDILVDLFVRNGFHVEQKTVVIAESGYPTYILPIVNELLNERPDLPVLLLHDVEQDSRMATRVQNSSRFALQGHPLIDLGLEASSLRLLKPLRQMKDPSVPVDRLAFGQLSTAFAASAIGGLTFAQMLEKKGLEDGDVDFDFG